MKPESFSTLSRREFLKTSIGLAGAAALESGSPSAAESPPAEKLKAVVIGHTGKGDYGHGLDVIFNERPDVEIVAVADPDATGRAKARERCQARREYADYRQMLEKERPHLVSVAPRWTDQHHVMALTALQTGAHVCLEKPFTQTLAEADDLLTVADKAGLRIAVAHQMRLAPSIQFLKIAIDQAAIGQLLEIRAHGKQDSRAGGEDMVVLGTHLFDLMRLFAGDAVWCTARILQSGREVSLKDAKMPTENIGPVIGDEIEAQFAFSSGVNGHFISRGNFRQNAGHWGMQLIGTKGTVRILADVYPNVFALKAGEWGAAGKTDEWRRLEGDPTSSLSTAERGFASANKRVVDDWLDSIRSRREPACSGRAAMKALEMVMAVFQAGVTRERVAIPLMQRLHPLRESNMRI